MHTWGRRCGCCWGRLCVYAVRCPDIRTLVCYSVFQCGAVCWQCVGSVLAVCWQCVAVCCSVLQCEAGCPNISSMNWVSMYQKHMQWISSPQWHPALHPDTNPELHSKTPPTPRTLLPQIHICGTHIYIEQHPLTARKCCCNTCNILQHTATHYSTLQHTATHSFSQNANAAATHAGYWNTLQLTTAHCNSLQHATTHSPS